MKENNLLTQKQMLCMNDSIVEWTPAKDGEKILGEPFLGSASDFSHCGRIVRSESQIKSVRKATEKEIESFLFARHLP